MWSRPVGEWDNYTVLLKDGDATVDTRTLARDVQECSFNKLMPGHTYTITVMTNSGDLSSSARVTGRTGGWVMQMSRVITGVSIHLILLSNAVCV